MIREGHFVLFRLPQTDLKTGKLRPALVLKKVDDRHNDWLICMISSRIYQYNKDIDEIISFEDGDFPKSGLKTESVIRVSRLAVVEEEILIGKIGEISKERLERIKCKICNWIIGKQVI